jgi:hypothetical protein
MLMPQAFHLLRHPILDAKILLTPWDNRYGPRHGSRALHPGRHAIASHLGVVPDPGTIDIRVLHLYRIAAYFPTNKQIDILNRFFFVRPQHYIHGLYNIVDRLVEALGA